MRRLRWRERGERKRLGIKSGGQEVGRGRPQKPLGGPGKKEGWQYDCQVWSKQRFDKAVGRKGD